MIALNVDGTIFIIGSGRSGTTILYNILATHPDLAWFSALTNRSTLAKGRIRLHRLLDAPLLGGFLRRSILRSSLRWPLSGLKPSEGEEVYNGYCGFEEDVKSTEEDGRDAVDAVERRFKDVIRAHLDSTRKPKFLTKRTSNTQRIRLIASMFPKAHYVHIIRDGRAVANSYLSVDWWNDLTLWWAGIKPSDWEGEGKEPIELCALHWKHNVEEILGNKDVLANYLELRYEDLVDDTRREIDRVLDFCGLARDGDFEGRLSSRLPNKNAKWKGVHSETIERVAGDTLRRLGYLQ